MIRLVIDREKMLEEVTLLDIKTKFIIFEHILVTWKYEKEWKGYYQ